MENSAYDFSHCILRKSTIEREKMNGRANKMFKGLGLLPVSKDSNLEGLQLEKKRYAWT